MELFVIRHAIAVPGSMLLADADRPLSPKGRARFAPAVMGLQRLKVRFDRLYHSPWLRACLMLWSVNGWPWWAMNHGWGS